MNPDFLIIESVLNLRTIFDFFDVSVNPCGIFKKYLSIFYKDISDHIYREATDPGPPVLLDGPGDLEVVHGAGGVTLQGELGEQEAELARGGSHRPHALSVVWVIGGVVWGLKSQAVAVKEFNIFFILYIFCSLPVDIIGVQDEFLGTVTSVTHSWGVGGR